MHMFQMRPVANDNGLDADRRSQRHVRVLPLEYLLPRKAKITLRGTNNLGNVNLMLL